MYFIPKLVNLFTDFKKSVNIELKIYESHIKDDKIYAFIRISIIKYNLVGILKVFRFDLEDNGSYDAKLASFGQLFDEISR